MTFDADRLGVAALPPSTLREQAQQAADLGHWSASKELVKELLRRDPGDQGLLARQAELSYESGDLAGAVAAYAELESRDALTTGEARRWIECLGRLGARQQLTHTLRRLVDHFVDDSAFLAFAADAFWELADLPVLDGKDRELELVRVAWATLLCAVLPGATDDDQGVGFIRRLEKIWESGQGVEPRSAITRSTRLPWPSSPRPVRAPLWPRPTC
ncbi:MAG: hypothetical protein IPL43_04880 [Micropruina sp.]|nr:hypothetical protein [Micropruina sp.]